MEGLANPIYDLDAKFDSDDVDADTDDIVNVNPLYDVVMKDFPTQSMVPIESKTDFPDIVELDSSSDSDDSIMRKLELQLSVPSDCEDEEQHPIDQDKDIDDTEKTDDDTVNTTFEIQGIENVGSNV